MKYLLYSLLLISIFSSCSSNLIKNPGAEEKPLTNAWTIGEGRWIQRFKQPSPQEGKAYFFPGVALRAELYQDVDVSRYSLLTNFGFIYTSYSGYVRAFPQTPADEAYEVIEFRNSSGTVIDSFASAHYDSTASWIHLTDKRTLPKGTETIRVRLLAIRHNGSNNDGYHDDLSLTLSVSPLVYLILVFIIVVVFWLMFRRQKKKTKPMRNVIPAE